MNFLSAPPSAPSRRVLVVDTETPFRQNFVDELARVGEREGFSVCAAAGPFEALARLDEEPIGLVIANMEMPAMGAFQLVAEFIHRRVRVATLALTATPWEATGPAELRGRTHLGRFTFLPTPCDFEDVLGAVREDLSRPCPPDDLPLAAFLQLLATENVRGVVQVRAGEFAGRILVSDGSMVSAEAADLRDVAAAHFMLALEAPTLELREHSLLTNTPVCCPLADLVAEAMRRHEERHRTSAPPRLEGEPMQEPLPSTIPPPSDHSALLVPIPRQSSPPSLPETNAEHSPRSEPVAQILVGHNPAAENSVGHALVPEVKEMNVEKANIAIEKLKETLGSSLLAADIWIVADGMSIAGHNSQPVATALFNQMTNMLNATLSESGFPGLGKYYLLDLDTDKLALILPCGEIRAGILADKSKVALGVVISVALPKFIAALESVVA